MFLDRNDDNAPNQAMRFTSLVLERKQASLEEAGRKEVLASFTVDSPIPYDLPPLVDALRQDDKEMVAAVVHETSKGLGTESSLDSLVAWKPRSQIGAMGSFFSRRRRVRYMSGFKRSL